MLVDKLQEVYYGCGRYLALRCSFSSRRQNRTQAAVALSISSCRLFNFLSRDSGVNYIQQYTAVFTAGFSLATRRRPETLCTSRLSDGFCAQKLRTVRIGQRRTSSVRKTLVFSS